MNHQLSSRASRLSAPGHPQPNPDPAPVQSLLHLSSVGLPSWRSGLGNGRFTVDSGGGHPLPQPRSSSGGSSSTSDITTAAHLNQPVHSHPRTGDSLHPQLSTTTTDSGSSSSASSSPAASSSSSSPHHQPHQTQPKQDLVTPPPPTCSSPKATTHLAPITIHATQTTDCSTSAASFAPAGFYQHNQPNSESNLYLHALSDPFQGPSSLPTTFAAFPHHPHHHHHHPHQQFLHTSTSPSDPRPEHYHHLIGDSSAASQRPTLVTLSTSAGLLATSDQRFSSLPSSPVFGLPLDLDFNLSLDPNSSPVLLPPVPFPVSNSVHHYDRQSRPSNYSVLTPHTDRTDLISNNNNNTGSTAAGELGSSLPELFSHSSSLPSFRPPLYTNSNHHYPYPSAFGAHHNLQQSALGIYSSPTPKISSTFHARQPLPALDRTRSPQTVSPQQLIIQSPEQPKDDRPSSACSSSHPVSASRSSPLSSTATLSTPDHSHNRAIYVSTDGGAISLDLSKPRLSTVTHATTSNPTSTPLWLTTDANTIPSSPQSTAPYSPFTPTSPFSPWSTGSRLNPLVLESLGPLQHTQQGRLSRPSTTASSSSTQTAPTGKTTDDGFAQQLWKLYGPQNEATPTNDALESLVQQLKLIGLDVDRIRQDWSERRVATSSGASPPTAATAEQVSSTLGHDYQGNDDHSDLVDEFLRLREQMEDEDQTERLREKEKPEDQQAFSDYYQKHLRSDLQTKNSLLPCKLDQELRRVGLSKPVLGRISECQSTSSQSLKQSGYTGIEDGMNSFCRAPSVERGRASGNQHQKMNVADISGSRPKTEPIDAAAGMEMCVTPALCHSHSNTDARPLRWKLKIRDWRAHSRSRSRPPETTNMDWRHTSRSRTRLNYPQELRLGYVPILMTAPGQGQEAYGSINQHYSYLPIGLGTRPTAQRKTQERELSGAEQVSLGSKIVVDHMLTSYKAEQSHEDRYKELIIKTTDESDDRDEQGKKTSNESSEAADEEGRRYRINSQAEELEEMIGHRIAGSSTGFRLPNLAQNGADNRIEVMDDFSWPNATWSMKDAMYHSSILGSIPGLTPDLAKIANAHSEYGSLPRLVRKTSFDEILGRAHTEQRNFQSSLDDYCCNRGRKTNEGSERFQEHKKMKNRREEGKLKKKLEGASDKLEENLQVDAVNDSQKNEGEDKTSEHRKKFSGGRSQVSKVIGEARKRVQGSPYSNWPPSDKPSTDEAQGGSIGSAPATECLNCKTKETPLWRRDSEGRPLCNACGLFANLHGIPRPAALSTGVIKRRNRVKNNNSGDAKKRSKGSIKAERMIVQTGTSEPIDDHQHHHHNCQASYY